MPQVTQRTQQLPSTIDFVAAGMGVAIVPVCMRRRRPESARSVSLRRLDPRAELGFAAQRDAPGRVVDNLLTVVE